MPLPPDPSRRPWYTIGGLADEQIAGTAAESSRVPTLPRVESTARVMRWVQAQPYSKGRLAAELLVGLLIDGERLPLQLCDVLMATVYELRQTAYTTHASTSPPPPAPAVPPVFPPPVPDRSPYRVEPWENCYAIVGADGQQVAHTGRLDLAKYVVARLNAETPS